ncbi:MAG: hypothetical protein IBJ03_03055 [Gemmatimonadaceae bacterium]|nr:hypothetical protein [Gemmatimonadaceae bacterium]
MFRVSSPAAVALTGLLLVAGTRVSAQSAKTGAAASKTAKSAAAPVQGAWSGTATVQLGDSAITVPVMYTFVTNNGTTTGTAVVPGQGSGQISNVVREGARLRFRVTAPENRLLEHDGQVASEQVIEGMVYMDQKPLAKFRITPAKTAPKNTP